MEILPNNFKVSVVVPFYNVSDYIERCAESLLTQSLEEIELIFVDDCSTDDSVDRLNAVVKRHSSCGKQIKILRMPNNSGACKARILGIKQALGEYIICVDSDDWIDQEALEKMFKLAKKKDADVVYCNHFVVDEKSGSLTNFYEIDAPKDYVKAVLNRTMSSSLWTKLVKRNLYSSPFLFPSEDMGEDFVMVLQLIYKAKIIVHLNECLYYYFYNNSSITKNMSEEAVLKRFKQSIANADVFFNFMQMNGLENQYKKEIELVLFNKKNLLCPLIRDPKYYFVWKKTFQDINYSIFLNPLVSINQKIHHFANLFNIHKKKKDVSL